MDPNKNDKEQGQTMIINEDRKAMTRGLKSFFCDTFFHGDKSPTIEIKQWNREKSTVLRAQKELDKKNGHFRKH